MLGQQRSQTPWKHKGLHPPPTRVIIFDCGHKVSLQTFLKDEGLPHNPLRASLHIHCYDNSLCSICFALKAIIGMKIIAASNNTLTKHQTSN